MVWDLEIFLLCRTQLSVKRKVTKGEKKKKGKGKKEKGKEREFP